MQRVQKSIRVAAPVDKVYQYWRNFENFPKFMDHVEEVRLLEGDGNLSHWKLKGPLGISVEFDSRLTKDEPNRSIGWNSTEGSIQTSGAVTFAETEHNTQITVIMQWYDPPGGAIGEALSRLLQDPENMLEEDLQRFKRIVEERPVPATTS